MSHFLDDRPFDRGRRESEAFVRILAKIYYDQRLAQAIVAKVRAGEEPGDGDEPGIPLGEINWNLKATQFWPEVLETAAENLVLRELYKTVVADKKAAADRDRLRAIAKPVRSVRQVEEDDDPEPVAASLLEDTTWDLVGRMALEHVIEADQLGRFATLLTQNLLDRVAAHRAPSDKLTAIMSALKQSPVTDDNPLILRVLLELYSIGGVKNSPESVFLLEAAVNLRTYLDNRGDLDATDEYQLPNGEVFLDRDEARNGLRSLLDEKLALIVRGEPHTGKTFTFRLIRHISGQKKFRFARATSEDAESALTLINFLAMQLDPNLKYPDRPKDDDAKWVSQACLWLVLQAKNRGSWWFVLDGYNGRRLNSEIRDTISRLAYYVWEQDADIRMVLLDYGGVMPTEIGDLGKEETLGLLEERHLREFFVRFFAKKRRRMDVNKRKETYIEDSVNRVWTETRRKETAQSQLPEDVMRKPFMQLLQEEIQGVIREYS